MAVEGDVGEFLVQLAAGLHGFKCDPEWVNMLRARDAEKEQANRCLFQPPVPLTCAFRLSDDKYKLIVKQKYVFVFQH